MREIQIQKIQRAVQVKDGDNRRKKVQKTYNNLSGNQATFESLNYSSSRG
jgi:hypothetical protein